MSLSRRVPKPVFRVFKMTLDDGTDSHIAMSDLREMSFREELANGRWPTIVSLELIHETEDRNEARNMADAEW